LKKVVVIAVCFVLLFLVACTAEKTTDSSIGANSAANASAPGEVLQTATATPTTELLETETSTADMIEPREAVRFVQGGTDMGITVGCNGETVLQDVENALKAHDVTYKVEGFEEFKFITLNDVPAIRWSFYFMNDALYKIYIFDKTFTTPEGFAVDDTVGKMKAMYGEDYQTSDDGAEPPITIYQYSSGIGFTAYDRDDMESAKVYMIQYGG
jgi:hypothetical protein